MVVLCGWLVGADTRLQWFGYLVKIIDPEAIDPGRDLQDFSRLSATVSTVWKRAFAIQLSMNPDWLAPAEPGKVLLGTRIRREDKVGMSRPAFVLVAILLGLNLIVACILYANRPKVMQLPRLPITVGRVLGLFYGSSLIEGQAQMGEDTRVGYGVFVGQDSRLHLGIERQSLLLKNGPGLELPDD